MKDSDPEPAPAELIVGERADTSQAIRMQGAGCCKGEVVGAQRCLMDDSQGRAAHPNPEHREQWAASFRAPGP